MECNFLKEDFINFDNQTLIRPTNFDKIKLTWIWEGALMHVKWSNRECVVFNLQQKYEVIKISVPNKNIMNLYFVMKNTLQMKEANGVNIMCFTFQ
jgi:hypothetical protein